METAVISIAHINYHDIVLKSKIPVAVFFWLENNRACEMVSVDLEDLAREYQGRILVTKINAEENLTLARRLFIEPPAFLMVMDQYVAYEHFFDTSNNIDRITIQNIFDEILAYDFDLWLSEFKNKNI